MKNNSMATIESNTFIKNKLAIKSYLKKNVSGAENGGSAEVKSCIFFNSIHSDLEKDASSIINISNSITDLKSKYDGLTKMNPVFIDEKYFNYKLDSLFVKNSLKNITIGYE